MIKSAFVIMPFKDPLNGYYKEVYKPVLEYCGYNVERADDIFSPTAIMKDIRSRIKYADIILCDTTDKNPNVFYELGLAHSIGKPVILVSQNMDDIPFDLRHLRILFYSTDIVKWDEKLKDDIKKAISKVGNKEYFTEPLTDNSQFSQIEYSIGRPSRINFCTNQLLNAKNSIFVSSPAMSTINDIKYILYDINANISITLAMLDYSNIDNANYIKNFFGMKENHIKEYINTWDSVTKNIREHRPLNTIIMDMYAPPYYAAVDYKEETEFSSIQAKYYLINEKENGVSIYTCTANIGSDLFDSYRQQILLIEELQGKIKK